MSKRRQSKNWPMLHLKSLKVTTVPLLFAAFFMTAMHFVGRENKGAPAAGQQDEAPA